MPFSCIFSLPVVRFSHQEVSFLLGSSSFHSCILLSSRPAPELFFSSIIHFILQVLEMPPPKPPLPAVSRRLVDEEQDLRRKSRERSRALLRAQWEQNIMEKDRDRGSDKSQSCSPSRSHSHSPSPEKSRYSTVSTTPLQIDLPPASRDRPDTADNSAGTVRVGRD